MKVIPYASGPVSSGRALGAALCIGSDRSSLGGLIRIRRVADEPYRNNGASRDDEYQQQADEQGYISPASASALAQSCPLYALSRFGALPMLSVFVRGPAPVLYRSHFTHIRCIYPPERMFLSFMSLRSAVKYKLCFRSRCARSGRIVYGVAFPFSAGGGFGSVAAAIASGRESSAIFDASGEIL